MNTALATLIRAGSGVVRRADALATVPHHVLDHALAVGRLIRVLPEVYLTPDALANRETVLRATVSYAGTPVAASHLTALRRHGLPVPDCAWTHLMTGETRHLRGAPGLLVHRRQGFRTEPPEVVVRQGVPVTRLETSIVDSWPLLDDYAKRAPAIVAVSRRLTTPARLGEALAAAPRIAGRRHLVTLVEKLAAGCRSPLELWGYDHVLRGPGLPRFRWQVPVALGTRTVYLDVYDEETRVNFELDGTAYHSSLADRERDLRRDAALATKGIAVVRLTHARLTRQADEVQAEIRAILRAYRYR